MKFSIEEATIAGVHHVTLGFRSKITEARLKRIAAHDKRGRLINSIITVNPSGRIRPACASSLWLNTLGLLRAAPRPAAGLPTR